MGGSQKGKEVYIDNIVVGDLLAFRVELGDEKLISGKVITIKSDGFGIQTKNGTQYNITAEHIAWVNTTGKWPKGVMDAFKLGIAGVEGED